MSLLLDTNIVSDLRRPKRGTDALFRWRDTVEQTPKYLSVISVLEIEYGVLLAEGRKEGHAEALRDWLENHILTGFQDAIIPVDVEIARTCAKIERIRTVPPNDALIAATALVHGLTMVTHNRRDFAGLGIDILDPYDFS